MSLAPPRPHRPPLRWPDPARWAPLPAVRRLRMWVGASRWRRRAVWVLALVAGAIVLPCGVGAVALAQTSGGNTVGSNAFSWMNVRDSTGTNVSNYMFTTNGGSILHVENIGMSLILTFLFAAWLALVITGIWLTGYVLSFAWMDLFATPLRAMSRTLAQQLTMSGVLILAATVGAFCVAWFWLRGLHAKAGVQIATMLIVAIIGPLFLSDPLGQVLSSDGWLAQGRDVGLSVAAGINGDSHPQPGRLVQTMQAQMADNFARKPLQVWNFGHVVDEMPSCGGAWTSGIASGSQDRVRKSLRDCGDSAAAEAATNPSAGQIASGLLLLISGVLLLAFAARLAIKIVRSALDATYHGIMVVFGFAAGGFVYGPSQTFLIRSLVNGFFAAVRMAAEVVFLALYLLLLGDLFAQARGQVMTVFVIGDIVVVIAISQLGKLGDGFDSGNDWIANRFALVAQGSGGGGGGGSALGMGSLGARHHLGFLGTLGTINAVAGFPGTEWLMGKTRNFLKPDAATDARANKQLWANADALVGQARRGAADHGGLHTARGIAAAALYATRAGAGLGALPGVLKIAGVGDADRRDRVINSWALASANAGDTPFGRTAAAARRVQGNLNLMLRGNGTAAVAAELAADVATAQMSAFDFHQTYSNGVALHGTAEHFVNEYMAAPSHERLKALGHIAAGTEPRDNEHDDVFVHYLRLAGAGVTRQDAVRIWSGIGNRHAEVISNAANAIDGNRPDPVLVRELMREIGKVQQTDRWTPDGLPSPWKTLVDGVDGQTP